MTLFGIGALVAKGTKISIKAKGTASGVKKVLTQILSAPERTVPLREADFRSAQKRKTNGI